MSIRKLSFVALLGVLAWASLPDTSQAQRYYGGRGRGVYVGSYGAGYGGYYGAGYRPGGYYSGGTYYSNGGVAYSQPASGASSYQSFYDGSGANSGGAVANDCCCANSNVMASSTTSTGGTTAQFQDGRGTVVVSNVPANAEIYWNGTRTSAFGGVRRFATSSLGNDGSVQKFEARWIGPDGKMVTQTREIRAQANQTVTLDWNNATNDRGEEATAPTPNPNQDQNSNPPKSDPNRKGDQ